MFNPQLFDFHRSVKLGKDAAIFDERRLKISNYFTSALPAPPPAVDYTGGVTAFGMMLNDQLGCCTISGKGHAVQTITLSACGTMKTVPDSVILSAYQNDCDYDSSSVLVGDVVTPYDQSTDNGGNEPDVLNDWRKNGFGGVNLIAYADANPLNLKHVCQAIYMFGGLYIGVQLPLSAQGQTLWDVSNGSIALPGSWGGHCVWVPKYRTAPDGTIIFTCITWGGLLDITQAFWTYSDPNAGPYIDETHALVVPDFINAKTGITPVGLNLAQMEADVQAITN